jgi:hypothetical protein
MDLQVTHRDLPGNPVPSTSNDVVENNNSDSESGIQRLEIQIFSLFVFELIYCRIRC